MPSNSRSALIGGDVALEGDSSWDRLDRCKIHTNNQAVRWHCLRSHLAPRPWGSTEVQEYLALLQKSILAIQLNELECSPCSVAFFFRKLVPFVEATFRRL